MRRRNLRFNWSKLTPPGIELRQGVVDEKNHFRIYDGERYVGRIYQADRERWFWSLAFEVTEPANPPYGWHEPSREAAMAKLKAAYLAVLHCDARHT